MTTTYTLPAYVAQPSGQQQLMMTQPAPPVAVSQSQERSWKAIASTGITQVVLGSLTIIFGIVTQTALKKRYWTDLGSPIWCGLLFYVVAGILGIVSGSKRSQGVAIAYMVMSILACLSACFVIIVSAVILASVNEYSCRYYSSNDYGFYNYRYNYREVCSLKGAITSVYAIVILLAVVEFVISIIGASMTCSPLCGAFPVTHTVVQYQVPPQTVPAGQPQGTAVCNTGQPNVVYPVGQGQITTYPAQPDQYHHQAQAPPTDQHQYRELTK
ncbi:uncharacterized protein LOC110981980 [Acanthaster planci]|uniref:Uncharacterized protein LOC110981980 n=1 Tax=Acanthaster planci TaxID=133434 RepID=A0A8B7YR44_ACAPL|nr:uncharacterized protein LOC110981980 [Acanthaster planci]XP_022095749.1 uncharacterized protein LOC110981980 [Acanthaster planci]XP_022095750.1 uncharacterized protein LOC110981980 [Acanthaster planci]